MPVAGPKPQHILLISGSHPGVPCGVGDYTSNLARSLVDLGAHVTVLTTTDPRLERDVPYELISIESEWRRKNVPSLVRQVWRIGPTIVHVQFPAVGYIGTGAVCVPPILSLLDPRTLSVLTLHEFRRYPQRARTQLRISASLSKLVIVPDPGELDGIRASLLPGRHPTIVSIPIASNISPSPVVPGRARSVRSAVTIGTWGFWRRDKGLEDLVEAVRLIARSRPARLVFAGDSGPDAAYGEQIRRQIEDAGLREIVTLGSWMPADELARVLASFDVCVFPYRDGVSPNRGTYKAAVESGLKVVTTSAPPSAPRRVGNTWFTRPQDAAALAAAIVQAADDDDVVQPPRVVTWREVAEAHLDAYERVVARKAR